ncbi:MAG: hypothetical protein NTW10_08575 [Bacteroidetes bacterium]|nr:hypothetical protein [Bacteroidota bacterium]MCX6306189.1 hypothetical protein [Bacteroidota bacterium]
MTEETEETKQSEPGNTKPVKPRPVLLTALCLFSFVYFGLLALLFLPGIFYSGAITGVIDKYLPTGLYSNTEIRMVFAAGFLLHALGLAGSIVMWNLRKTGYYLLAGACIIVASMQTFRPDISVTSTAVYIIFILLFGVFFKRLH